MVVASRANDKSNQGTWLMIHLGLGYDGRDRAAARLQSAPEYVVKDTDILAAFRMTPQPGIPPKVIGFSELIYFVRHEILELWRTSKFFFTHFLLTTDGRKCFAWDHPFWLQHYLHHDVNLASNIFGRCIISRDININVAKICSQTWHALCWAEGIGRRSRAKDLTIQVDI